MPRHGGCAQRSLTRSRSLSGESVSAVARSRGRGLARKSSLGLRRIRVISFSRSVVPCSFVRSLLSFGFDSPFGCVSHSRTFIYNFLTPLHRFLCSNSPLSSLRICCVLGFFQLNNNKSHTHTATHTVHTHLDTDRETDRHRTQ